MLFPDTFIPLAEKENLANPLTDVVLAQAVLQCAAWRRSGLSCKVAVNLSPKMLTDRTLPERLTKIVSKAGITPEDLILEVTESGMFVDDLLSMEIVARLDLRGYSISIDDFGTGYSSIQQLQRLPFAELKIDRIFVNGAAHSSVNQTVIRSSVELARKLKMSVVAEGVETAEDWSFVCAAGCNIAQGYFIARPMPAAVIVPWVASWQARTDIPSPAAISDTAQA
jgi:EAL domain-containing protein (putative c-di-GMP-specific phosphodiesterase class I)